MSQATAAGNAPATTSSPGAMGVAYIRGRIRSRRRSKRGGVAGVLTVITMPAADAYSLPQAVEVFSAEVLGDVGADVSVKVQIGGFPRSYERAVDDDEFGKRKETVHTADNTLTVVA